VGQGDALFVRAEGYVVMVDTGRDQRALERCLGLLRITHIDLLVITHFDADHVGAWRVVSGMSPQVWVGARDDERGEEFINDFRRSGLKVTAVSEGERLVMGSTDLDVVWPPVQPLSEPGNDSSIVLSLVPGAGCSECLSAVFLGDLGEGPQRIMQGRHPLRAVDVVKVSHHGSADQHQGLYQALAASISLIGVGADNSYGHPASSVLAMLGSRGVVVRSDTSGTATLYKNDTGDIVVWSER
jgi:competence protein ComEC